MPSSWAAQPIACCWLSRRGRCAATRCRRCATSLLRRWLGWYLTARPRPVSAPATLVATTTHKIAATRIRREYGKNFQDLLSVQGGAAGRYGSMPDQLVVYFCRVSPISIGLIPVITL